MFSCFHNSIRILLPLDLSHDRIGYLVVFIFFFLLYIYIFVLYIYIFVLYIVCIYFFLWQHRFRASPVVPCTRYYTLRTYFCMYIHIYRYIFFFWITVNTFVVDVVVVVTVVFCSVSESVYVTGHVLQVRITRLYIYMCVFSFLYFFLAG